MARTAEILDIDKSAGLSILCIFRLYACDNTSYDDILTIGEFGNVVEIGTAGVAQVVEHDTIFVERMGGEIDAHEIALFVESLYVAPLFALDNGRCGYFHSVVATEE